MKRKLILAGAGIAGVLAIGGTTTAALASSGSAPQAAQTTHAQTGQKTKKGLDRLCNREPARAARVSRLIARYSGSATTKGSVAWYNAKATKLQSTNPGLAKLATDTANVRQSELATLKLRQQTQTDTVSYCATKGHPVS
jgi:hypothetical protein